MLLEIEQIQQHVQTDLGRDAIERLIQDAEAEIISWFGPHGDSANPITEDCEGGGVFIFLTRPADSITSVTERSSDGTETVMQSDDYRSQFNGRALKRLATGTNGRSRWDAEAVVVYLSDQTIIRRRVLMDLVKLAIQHEALQGQDSGEYSEQQLNYEAERTQLLARLKPGRMVV